MTIRERERIRSMELSRRRLIASMADRNDLLGQIVRRVCSARQDLYLKRFESGAFALDEVLDHLAGMMEREGGSQ